MDAWWTAIAMTFRVAAAAAVIAGMLGTAMGFLACLLTLSGRRPARWVAAFWSSAMIVSLAVPLILHAAAWEATAGKFGWLAQTMTGGNWLWVAWIHGVHGAALVGILTAWSTLAIEPDSIPHARLDFPPAVAWWGVRWPIASPWMALSIIGVVLLAATEMSVADLHSVRTVADQFYLFFAADPDATSILVLTIVPLSLVVALLSIHTMICFRRIVWVPPSSLGRRLTDGLVQETGAAFRWPVALALLALGLVVGGLPVAGLLIKAGHTVAVTSAGRVVGWSFEECWRSLASAPRLFAQEYAWTAQISFFTAVAVLPPAILAARWVRGRRGLGALVDGLAMFLFFVPGPLVGLGVIQATVWTGALGQTLATRTLVPVVMAVGWRAGLAAYLVLRVGMSGIDARVWQSARLAGSRPWRVWHIERPLLWGTVLIAAAVAAILSGGDVAAMLPVLPPGVTTVASRLFGLLHSGARYQEASLAFWYLAGVLAVWIAVAGFRRRANPY